jgi:hypothetical protein
MDPISKAFITAVERFVVEEQIPCSRSPRDSARMTLPRTGPNRSRRRFRRFGAAPRL